ncbi:hypothetical protein ABW20_dc0104279 [Dactylellina cionopaga]|nr:hypothetical protein ABW20_dc0104279 [Dactylellina cionopaga]
MPVRDFFRSFDEAKYASEIGHLKEPQLRNLHDKVRKKVVAAVSSTAVGGATTIVVGPIGLVGVGIGLRRQSYNSDKLNIIENRMLREGWEIPTMRKRDILLAAGPAIVAGVVAPGAEHAIGHVAGHGAQAFLGHHAGTAVDALVKYPEVFTHSMADGALAQSHAIVSGLTGHATHLISIDSISITPQSLGFIAGQAVACAAEVRVVEEVSQKGFSTLVRNSKFMKKDLVGMKLKSHKSSKVRISSYKTQVEASE